MRWDNLYLIYNCTTYGICDSLGSFKATTVKCQDGKTTGSIVVAKFCLVQRNAVSYFDRKALIEFLVIDWAQNTNQLKLTLTG